MKAYGRQFGAAMAIAAVLLSAGGCGPSPVASDPDADGRFSLAIYPDTQLEVVDPNGHLLSGRNEWVVQQRQDRDIRYVLHVGDMIDSDAATDSQPDNHPQFESASREMRNLDASGLPWAVAVGNHDTYAHGPVDGSPRPGVKLGQALRDTHAFNQFFGPQRFPGLAGTFESGKSDNAFRFFTAGSLRWMILNLELYPRETAVAWANKAIKANADKNVILLTHGYLTPGGAIENDKSFGAKPPQYIHDQLVAPNPNVKLVFSGHHTGTAVRTDTEQDGRKVVSMLTCFHSPNTNELRLVEVDTRQGSVATSIWRPVDGTHDAWLDSTVTGLAWVT